MGQVANDATAKDVQTWLSKEEFVKGMERRSNANDAAAKDVRIKPKKEEFVLGTGQNFCDYEDS
jgi:hypothetical protein